MLIEKTKNNSKHTTIIYYSKRMLKLNFYTLVTRSVSSPWKYFLRRFQSRYELNDPINVMKFFDSLRTIEHNLYETWTNSVKIFSITSLD